MDQVFFIYWIIGVISILAIVAPSLGVASQDKDKDCSKPLWTWILVCNICLLVNIVLPIIALNQDSQLLYVIISLLLNLFLIIWAIIGLVWATRSGIKDECGKLYNVTLGDGIAILCLFVLSIILIILFLCALAAALSGIN
ncbi:hypothetical protein M0811_03489 [Anaeramoeba ignava]|uniref:Uncharacterized protein n=1 Tax=Anaeramoeba ignava TaxID=1746090 RepID=A0A9Q0L507_ANAIG|nr:hypothetical protein M0811_03489 [Anaeramoeba ignava]